MEATRKELIVSAIENGTVIDHIPADKVFKVIDILGLQGMGSQMTIGVNLDSRTMGKKGIIKIADKFFEPEEVDRIALVAPHAKLNIIRGYRVEHKEQVEVPAQIVGIVKCINPKCITNVQDVTPKFVVESTSPMRLRCAYCDKVSGQEQILESI
ncbi:MAG: aspartate carbamoyltransferase regulatory subunit [Bacteroidia bacterium]|nr:MAG: aspartate carbamoyltransferase regulatory subunit [Bacteroidia bacterium]